MSTSPLCFKPLIIGNALKGNSRIVDVGCGYGINGFLAQKYGWSKESGTPYVVGLDKFAPHVEALKREGFYDKVIEGDAIALPFEDGEFDFGIGSEVIEHLSKQDAPKFISEMKRVCRNGFAVTTPGFPCIRGGDETKDGYNPFEAHLNNPAYNEFASLFTQVVGVGNLQIGWWHLGRALSGLGLYPPFARWSRYWIGFHWSDGKKRLLETE